MMNKTLVGALLGAYGAFGVLSAVPSHAQDVIIARGVIIESFERRGCVATAAEIQADANAAGLARSDFQDALRILRGEGSLYSGVDAGGTPAIELRGEGVCGGPKHQRPQNPVEAGGTPTNASINATIAYMQAVGCVTTASAVRSELAAQGFSDDEAVGALSIMGRTGRIVTQTNGIRLTQTPGCP